MSESYATSKGVLLRLDAILHTVLSVFSFQGTTAIPVEMFSSREFEAIVDL